MDDSDDWVQVELTGGPESVLCNPEDVREMPECRPVLGFSVYVGRHVKR